MFPRTRRCLTGTYPRPIVTARTSRSPRPFEAPGKTRNRSAVAQQEVQTPANAESQSPEGAVKFAGHVQHPQDAATPLSNGAVEISRRVAKRVRRLKIERYHTDQINGHLNSKGNWRGEARSDTTRYTTAKNLVGQLLENRARHLPRSSAYTATLALDSADQEFVPTFVTARRNLGAVRNAPHNSTGGTEARRSKTPPFVERQIDALSLAKFIAKIPKSSRPLSPTVELDPEFVQAYTGSFSSNAWNEAIGAGVHVQLLPPSSQTKSRLAILTGSEYYKNLVLEKLTGEDRAREAPDSQSSADPDNLSSITSHAAFTRFVERLTNPFPQRRTEKWLYEDYHKYAADLLRWMFVNPRVSQYASTAALIQALKFLHRHPDLLKTADALYVSGRRNMLVQNVAVMNVCLKFALLHNLGPTARSTTRDMMQFNIRPNSTTWSIIYSALRTPEERLQLVRIMRNYKVPIDQRGWSRLASAALLGRLRHDGDDVEKLIPTIRDLDDAFGPAWLDGRVINQVLRTCARQDLYKVAEHISEVARARNVSLPKSANVHQFGLLRGQKNFNEAIDLLMDTASSKDDLYHRWIIPYVFRIAWLRFRPNTCHLLWIYAASRGLITRGMHKMVTKALLDCHSSKRKFLDLSSSQLRRLSWRRIAARIISGFDEDAISAGIESGERFLRLRDYVSKLRGKRDNPSIAEMLTIWTPDDGTRDEQIALTHVMMGHDLNAWKTLDEVPIDVLSQQLHLAAERDQQLSAVAALDEFISQDPTEARQESLMALRGCILRRADGELSPSVRRGRDVVLRNLRTAALQPKVPIERDSSGALQDELAYEMWPGDSPYDYYPGIAEADGERL